MRKVNGDIIGAVKFGPLHMGGSGYCTGLDIHSTGAMLTRTDVYGAYLKYPGDTQWRQIMLAQNMPAADKGPEFSGGGAYEAVFAPSDDQYIVFARYGYIYKSTNGCLNTPGSITRTAFPQKDMNANRQTQARMSGKKIAIDPANKNVWYVCTEDDGVWRTENGGTTWAKIASIPNGIRTLVAFNPASGTTGTGAALRTNELLIAISGTGVYRSSNGGGTFALTAGGPAGTFTDLVCSVGGKFYICDETKVLKRCVAGTWASLTAVGEGFHTVAVNPANENHLIGIREFGAYPSQTFNGGTDWIGPYFDDVFANKVNAQDIPWLGSTEGIAAGAAKFHPTSGRLFLSMGKGVISTAFPATYAPISWRDESKGIEELVTNLALSPPGGKMLYAGWDRPVFYDLKPDAFPGTYGPTPTLSHCWDLAYATNDPSFVVALVNYYSADTHNSAYSTQGGADGTWVKFPTNPTSAKVSGCMTIGSTNDMIIMVEGQNGRFRRTINRGQSWTDLTIGNVPTDNNQGWNSQSYLKRYILATDKVVGSTIYAYNSGANANVAGTRGLWRSKLDGAQGSWSRVFTGAIGLNDEFNTKLFTVPGKQGHLFFSSGHIGGVINPADSNFWFSTNADGDAVTFTAVAGMKEVVTFGFGKAAPGHDYPAIFLNGYHNGGSGSTYTYGIWGCFNFNPATGIGTWRLLTTYPDESIDDVVVVSGDVNNFGIVVVGFSGSGWKRGRFESGSRLT